MKILVVSQYYWPEQFQITEVCEELVARGHEVTVLTGLPNYPVGDIYEGYEKGQNREQEKEGVRIVRVPLIPRRHDPVHLALNYHSFAHNASAAVKELPGDFDVVYVPEISPVTMIEPAARYKEIHDVPLLVYCCDLWPESLKTILGDHGKPILQAYKGLSRKLYEAADVLAVQSPAFMDYLEQTHGLARDGMTYIPQFADEAYLDMEFDVPHEGINFTVAGNMGRAQDIPVLLRAVESMSHTSGFTLNFYGDGSCYEEIKEYVEKHGLTDRVKLWGRKPYEELPEVYAKTDAFLLALNGDSWVGTTIPSRLQGYMAVGKPVLAAVRGGAADVIREANCGRAVGAGDYAGLARVMDEFLDSPQAFTKYGEAGRRYFRERFTKTQHIDAIESQLMALASRKDVSNGGLA